jgi:actin-like ATPase involved in cell morphogenesis
MQVVKPEWIPLQAQFVPLALNERISRIQDELKGLKREIDAQQPEAMSSAPDSFQFILRKIQRYVEWTAPDLLPDRAEEAEILVNVGRFASRLSIQEASHSSDQSVAEIEQHLVQLSTVLDVDRANFTH